MYAMQTSKLRSFIGRGLCSPLPSGVYANFKFALPIEFDVYPLNIVSAPEGSPEGLLIVSRQKPLAVNPIAVQTNPVQHEIGSSRLTETFHFLSSS
jgi:hypothetical protein